MEIQVSIPCRWTELFNGFVNEPARTHQFVIGLAIERRSALAPPEETNGRNIITLRRLRAGKSG